MENSETRHANVKVSGEVALLAWALILGGVVIVIFILKELLGLYLDLDSNSFIAALTHRFSDTTLVTLGDFPVDVTEQGAAIIAYFVFVPISLLGVHIAVALIRAGSHLLSPVFPYQISRLKQRIDQLRERLDKA
jgi:hypothetical protein